MDKMSIIKGSALVYLGFAVGVHMTKKADERYIRRARRQLELGTLAVDNSQWLIAHVMNDTLHTEECIKGINERLAFMRIVSQDLT